MGNPPLMRLQDFITSIHLYFCQLLIFSFISSSGAYRQFREILFKRDETCFIKRNQAQIKPLNPKSIKRYWTISQQTFTKRRFQSFALRVFKHQDRFIRLTKIATASREGKVTTAPFSSIKRHIISFHFTSELLQNTRNSFDQRLLPSYPLLE